MIDEKIFKKISNILKKEEIIEFAYIFGSYAAGLNREDSDIDLAIYLKENINIDYEYPVRLALKIEKRIGIPVDVIILNDKPILIISEVLKNGIVVFSKNERKRIFFETKMLSQIQDFNELMKEYDEMRLKRYGVR